MSYISVQVFNVCLFFEEFTCLISNAFYVFSESVAKDGTVGIGIILNMHTYIDAKMLKMYYVMCRLL